MLGRPFSMMGTQKRDRGVGSRLLVPTINLAPCEGMAPGNGVYITHLHVAGRRFQAVTNVGTRPTFDGAGFGVESHILNFAPVEMDQNTLLEVEFLMRLRDEKKFDSTASLKAQIMNDVARARRFFSLTR
jgi:riboflavin kinase/FMN adenylyltransferase